MNRVSTRRVVWSGVGGVLAVLALLTLAPRTAWAQPITGTESGIVAVGFGEASAPASSASLQFLIGPNEFGMMGGMPPDMVIEGTPGAEGMPSGMEMFGPPSLTAEQLGPIVDALVAAGATEDAIEVTVPDVSSAFYGPGGPQTGEIRVNVDQPDAQGLSDLVTAGRDAATNSGLSVFHVGVRYDVADCAALVQQAREAAVADAQERAEGLAQAVGASLGDLVQASEFPYFGPTGSGSCGAEGSPEQIYGPYGPGTDPPFDPSAAAEAEVYVQVSLTYAFGDAA